MLEYLILPGYGGSGPKHWQTHWEKMDETFTRIEQKDWDRPDRAEWVEALDNGIARAGDSVILVAHSLACLLVAHWAVPGTNAPHRRKVKGAFLVAVPDPDEAAFPEAARSFAPVPMLPLPFSTLIIASSDDPYASPDFARRCASAWGGGVIVVGAKGHINAESGLGSWEEGRRMLDSFT
jgi:predicted alpha/beta hydrolase family esterase